MGTPRLLDQHALVIGANGFIGRHVVRRLLAEGAAVRIMDISPATEEFSQLEQVTGSVADTELMASAVDGVDLVIYLANSSLPGSASDDLSGEVTAHVAVTVKAAEICAQKGVKRFLFASSGGTVYGASSEAPLKEDSPTRPRNAYGASKLSIEHYLSLLRRERGLITLPLRISNPYGRGQRALRSQGFIAAAMQHAVEGTQLSIWGDGSVQRDFLHISDLVEAFVAAALAEDPPEVVNIGSGRAVSLREVLEQVEAAVGRKIDVTYAPGRHVDVARNVLDITRARETLGWEPQVSLGEGLARTAKWWLERSE